ncbi:pyruvate kinase [Candidatus Desantisbacteria bacterium]|nr:pyruvate kinase [Candidatus Desantisbacteria bacterium]
MKKAKIICTIGPATNQQKILREMVDAGMDMVKLNFSYGSYSEHQETIEHIRGICRETGKHIGIIQEISGQRVRVGQIPDTITLKEDFVFTLTTDENAAGDNIIPVTYPNLPKEMHPGELIYLNEGQISLKVIRTSLSEIICKVIRGGRIQSNKAMNLPMTNLKLPSITDKDEEDLLFGIKTGVDMISLGSVRTAKDVQTVRAFLKKNGADIPLIARIERAEAINNLDEIIKASNGIRIIRGELGIEIPLERLPLVHKGIIAQANLFGKPVITATGILNSMIENSHPSMVEVADVANAVFDMTDAFMLSEETSIGKYPVECIKTLIKIINGAEASLEYEGILRDKSELRKISSQDAIAYAICQIGADLRLPAIIAYTRTGAIVQQIAKYRPAATIIALSPNETVLQRMALYWSVLPLKTEELSSIDDIIEAAKSTGCFHSGDKVIVAGNLFLAPIGSKESTNSLQVVMV